MSSTASLESLRLRVVLATVVVNITAVIAFAFFPWSDWRTGLALNLLDNALLIGFALRHRDRLIAHLLVFGLIIGSVELAADAWLVDVTKTLDYSIGGGPMLWRSPIWMPFAWQIVAVQFGYLGLRLMEWRGALGLVLVALLGAINIPFYEEMALKTNWWRYEKCRLLLHTPYYIILGECLIAAAFAVLAKWLRRERWVWTLLAGVLGGLAIFVAYVAAFVITDGWPK